MDPHPWLVKMYFALSHIDIPKKQVEAVILFLTRPSQSFGPPDFCQHNFSEFHFVSTSKRAQCVDVHITKQFQFHHFPGNFGPLEV